MTVEFFMKKELGKNIIKGVINVLSTW